MILSVEQHPSGVWINLTAETVADAALLVRLKMNALKIPPSVDTFVGKDGTVKSTVCVRYRADEVWAVQTYTR